MKVRQHFLAGGFKFLGLEFANAILRLSSHQSCEYSEEKRRRSQLHNLPVYPVGFG